MRRQPLIALLVSRDEDRSVLLRVLASERYSVRDAIGPSRRDSSRDTSRPDLVVIDRATMHDPAVLGLIEDAERAHLRVGVVMVGDTRDAPFAEHERRHLWPHLTAMITRPLTRDRIELAVRHGLELGRLRAEAHRLQDELVQARRDGDHERPPIPGASLDAIERYAILRTLEHFAGSTTRAAAVLGISARKIQYKLLQYAA